jgi:hypothetical protein
MRQRQDWQNWQQNWQNRDRRQKRQNGTDGLIGPCGRWLIRINRIPSHSYCPETVPGFEGPPEPRIICPPNRRHRPPRPCFFRPRPSVSPCRQPASPLLLFSSLLVVSLSPQLSIRLILLAAFESRSHITCLPLATLPHHHSSLSLPALRLSTSRDLSESLSQPPSIDRFIGAHITPSSFLFPFFSFSFFFFLPRIIKHLPAFHHPPIRPPRFTQNPMDATQHEKHEFDFFPQEFAQYSDADMLRLVLILLLVPPTLLACFLPLACSSRELASGMLPKAMIVTDSGLL